MPKGKTSGTDEKGSCCGPDCCGGKTGCCGMPGPGCCQVEAVVNVDSRGQMVLPKEIREMTGIKADDKLAIVAWKQDGKVCCLSLLKVDELAEAVRKAYGPMLTEIVRG